MRCKSCDYPLWNLKTRKCPECGREFLPSEYEFVINSVRFCCPHCDQPYYGTGPSGHLVPFEFNCVTCSRRITMNEMVLRPSEGVSETQTQIERMPWLERSERGFVRAWFAMIGHAMVYPNRLMRATPPESSMGTAWSYAAVTSVIFLLTGLGLPLLALGLVAFLNGDRDATGMLLGSGASTFGGMAVLLGAIGLWGIITQGLLRMTGGCEFSIGRTYQALLYSIGTMAPVAVPCLGWQCASWFVWIWWIVSAVIMVAVGQRVHGGRAAFAVLVTPVLVVALMVGGYGYLMYSVMSGLGPFGAAGMTTLGETATLTNDLRTYTFNNGNRWPAHAVELISKGGIGSANFIALNSSTLESNVPVADATLDQFAMLPTNKQAMATQAAANALPSNVVAHRLGDFVFTYHGIDPVNGDPSLWLVILCPDPANNPGSNPTIWVGHLDGFAHQVSGSFSNALQMQNALRATYGLPPLPDPATVTHAQPAVGTK